VRSARESAEEYGRSEKSHIVRGVMEELSAVRLAVESESLNPDNARLLEAVRRAEEMHRKEHENAGIEAKLAARLASEKEQLAEFSQKAVNKVRKLREQIVDLPLPPILERLETRGNTNLRFKSVIVVVPIGSALICLTVVMFLYIFPVGIAAMTFIGLLVLALIGITFNPALAGKENPNVGSMLGRW